MLLWEHARQDAKFTGTITQRLVAAPRPENSPTASGFEVSSGTWHPSAKTQHNPMTSSEVQARYGWPDFGVGYRTENAGPHGAWAIEARELALAMWPDAGGDGNFDLLDLDRDLRYVQGLREAVVEYFKVQSGAEQWLIGLGWDQVSRDVFFGRPRADGRQLDGSLPGQLVPGTVPDPGPAAPLQPYTDRQLIERIASGVDALLASPGGDKALAALRALKAKAGTIDALVTRPKHQRYDELMKAIEGAFAEGVA